MLNVKIVHVENLLPSYSYSNEEIISWVSKWIKDKDDTFRRKVKRIFQSSNIKERHSVIPIEKIFSPNDIEESMCVYRENAIELGSEALKKALVNKGWDCQDLDYIITTSCTGFMIPSFDAYVINKLGLRKDIIRLPVTEVGCTAGAASLIYANEFLKSNPNKKMAIINLEFPSNTIQLNDFSLENMVGTAIFADGVSVYLVSSEANINGIEVLDTQMLQAPNTEDILRYDLTNSGLSMKLDRNLPNMIAESIHHVVGPFLEKNKLSIKKVDKILIHPGGFKILKMLDKVLIDVGKNLKESRYVMETYGNLSSATLGFILKNYIENKANNDADDIVMLGFGPGFATHQLLLKWNGYGSI